MSFRRIAMLLVLAGLILVLRFRLGGVDPAKDNAAAGTGERVVLIEAGESTEADSTSTNAKSRLRPATPSITRADTIELLKATVIHHFELKDESLADVVSAINQAIREARVPEGQLRVSLDARGDKAFEKLRIRELKLQNVPLSDLFKYLCGNTKLRYQVDAGTVSLGSALTFDQISPEDDEAPPSLPELDPTSQTDDDPFAEGKIVPR